MTLSSTAPMPFCTDTDPGMSCLSFGALTLWHLGYPDQALKRSHEAAHPGPASCLTPLAWRMP